MVMPGAVPARGSWNTRPMARLRWYSRCLVTSASPRSTRPEVSGKVPATALSKVDLPEPLEPMMLMNCPAGTSRSTPAQGHDLVGGVGEEHLAHRAQLQAGRPHARTTLARTVGTDRATTTSTAVSSLQVGGRDAQPQAHGDEQAVHDGAADGAEQHPAHVALAEQHLAHDDTGKAGDDGADAHAHVGEALLLRHQRAGQGHQGVGDAQARDAGEHRVGAHGADHLLIVAGGSQAQAELGVQEPVQQVLHDERQHGKYTDEPPVDEHHVKYRADLVEEHGHAQQGDVALAHDAQVHGVKSGHGEDAGQQLGAVVGGVAVPRARFQGQVQQTGDEAGQQAGEHAGRGGQQR